MLARLGRRLAAMPTRLAARAMSTDAETAQEARAQMIRWTKISAAMLMLSGAYTVIQYYAHLNEDHGHEVYGGEEPQYSYLKIRNKPYPWHYSNCDLLDFRCKELARAAEGALKKQ